MTSCNESTAAKRVPWSPLLLGCSSDLMRNPVRQSAEVGNRRSTDCPLLSRARPQLPTVAGRLRVVGRLRHGFHEPRESRREFSHRPRVRQRKPQVTGARSARFSRRYRCCCEKRWASATHCSGQCPDRSRATAGGEA